MKDQIWGSETRGKVKEKVELTVDGCPIHASEGSSVAAAILSSQNLPSTGWAPLCGMGVCWGCRATINGRANSRSCLVTVADGMQVHTALATQLGEKP